MKIIELINHIQLPITNEEADVLAKFDSQATIDKQDLEPREQMLASQLVNKGALVRKNNNGKIEFRKHINN